MSKFTKTLTELQSEVQKYKQLQSEIRNTKEKLIGLQSTEVKEFSARIDIIDNVHIILTREQAIDFVTASLDKATANAMTICDSLGIKYETLPI